MRIATIFASTVVAIGLAAAATPSQAAQLAPLQPLSLVKSQSLAQPAGYYRWRHHRGYCVRWRHRCAHRWGWGTWRFRRCVVNHGC
jgi:hypothetical protein